MQQSVIEIHRVEFRYAKFSGMSAGMWAEVCRSNHCPRAVWAQKATNREILPQTVLALRGSYGAAKGGAMTCLWLPSRLPRSSNTVNFPSTLMSPSKNHRKIDISRELLHFSFIFTAKVELTCLRSPWEPLGSPSLPAARRISR